MQTFTAFSGKPYPVTDEWYATNITAFPGIEKLDYAQLKGTIRGLHQKHDARVEAIRVGVLPPDSPLLSEHEFALIGACVAVINFNAKVVALRGRDLAKTYGVPTGIDRVNLTHWTPDTCKCEHQYVWHLDHGGEGQPERVHYGHTAVKKCPEHAHLKSHEDHFAEVLAKNQHKNGAVNTVADVLGLENAAAVEWAYDDSGALAVKHPALTPDKHAEVATAIANHPLASKRPVKLG